MTTHIGTSMSDKVQQHPELTECEYLRGYWVYWNEKTSHWVAFRSYEPIEATGKTRTTAIQNAKQELDDHYGMQTTYWDMWVMDCPDCDDKLTPLRSSVDDCKDTRVYCSTCDLVQTLHVTPIEQQPE